MAMTLGRGGFDSVTLWVRGGLMAMTLGRGGFDGHDTGSGRV